MHNRRFERAVRRTGVAFFAVAVVTLHGLHPELDFRTRAVSEYASTSSGWLMVLAFFALAGAIGSAAFAFRPVSRPISAMLAGATAGLVAAGVFPADAWTSTELSGAGLIHGLGTLLVFLGMLLVAFLAPRAIARSHRATPKVLRRARLLAWALLVAFFAFGAALVLQGQSGQGWAGLFQRVYIIVLLVWVGLFPDRLQD